MKSGFFLRAVRNGLFAFCLAGAVVPPHAQAEQQDRLVIFDDDGFALAQWMVLKAPHVKVLGFATVSGDFWQKEATAYALRGVEIANRPDVPVVAGATYPLLNTEKRTERWESLYGKLVWKGAWMKQWVEKTNQPLPPYHAANSVPDLPWGNPKTKAAPETAVSFMLRMVHQYPGQVSIIECGPMTNLALAQKLDPEFASLAKELVYMGGSLNPQQKLNTPAAAQFAREFGNSPRREFNIRFDPEAASIVMHAPWKKIVMVPADPSTETEMSEAFVKDITQSDTPVARIMRKSANNFPLWDEIAAVVWLDPSLIRTSTDVYVDVNTAFDAQYGDILSWSEGYQPRLDEQKEHVVLRVDVPRMKALIKDLIARP
ncbi:nucleoside hydrolase [Acetobacter orientalis]|uniref:nucleoside hydrolase n=1 Tax=Acetobacter orientalis TaxID=146474 RepID=UPI0039EC7A4D